MESEKLFAVLKVCSTHAQCPKCKRLSHRRHSRYAWSVDDLPVSGHSVHLTVLLQKWYCANPECKTKIFTERLNWLSASSRKTNKLEKADSPNWIFKQLFNKEGLHGHAYSDKNDVRTCRDKGIIKSFAFQLVKEYEHNFFRQKMTR
ncbi:transposase family protein [Bacillus sp. OV322]|uniref:transposase family protein n=1 Tax=Bacillus sp. OV322 TaxID=1882764 RepID=UPI00114D3E96|nr:transposase family protein [Bacillus sp. OV322]